MSRLLEMAGITFIIIFFNNLENHWISIAMTAFFIGVSTESYCYIENQSCKTYSHLKFLIPLSILSIISAFVLAYNLNLKLAFNSLFISSLFLYVFYVLNVLKKASKVQAIIGWISLIASIAHICLSIYLLKHQPSVDDLAINKIQITTSILWVIYELIFPMIFLLLIKEETVEKLEQINKTKNNFFSTIGDDIKPPITQMIKFSDELINLPEINEDPRLSRFVDAMKESSIRGSKLLENLLEWAKTQTGTLRFNAINFLINPIIEENIELHKKQCFEKNIKIINNIHANISLIADQNMINTVIRNILSNAVKFTRFNGSIEINATKRNRTFILKIKDNGIGMTKKQASSIFEINNNIIRNGTNNEKGTGLGLILCKEFIDLHNGNIQVISEKDKGTTFVISIPQIKKIEKEINKTRLSEYSK
ncbi:MAG: HAMP domain-containing histidine kinase [Marinifilaceae bacterium]|nr:HAMP domain-containing histidine kinase [Marinifilaceae bacterium]